MAPAELDPVVADVVAAEPSVLAAWIFGSRARGDARRDSDLDVAFLVVPGTTAAPGLEDRIAGEIARRTTLDADVSRIGTDRPLLAFEVLAEGRRVFARDAAAADAIEERIRWTYLDTAHLRRVQNHYRFGDPL